jgi:hypothetical protein
MLVEYTRAHPSMPAKSTLYTEYEARVIAYLILGEDLLAFPRA